MRNKANVINTIPPTPDYPFGRLKDDTGVNDGTPVVEQNNGDIQETVTYFMETAKISPNELPDNFSNGHQIAQAMQEVAGKFDKIWKATIANDRFSVDFRLDNMQINDCIMVEFKTSNQSDTQNVQSVNKIATSVFDVVLFDCFAYADYNGNFFNNGRYIIQKLENNQFSMYPIAATTVLDNIYDRLDNLEIEVKNHVFYLPSVAIPNNANVWSVPVPDIQAMPLDNIISWEISWTKQSDNGTNTFIETNKTINMTSTQAIELVTLTTNSKFVRFTGFNNTALNNVKFTILYKS